MYDFSQLSPADFEELTRDLLQKHLEVPLESFRKGRDGGIDLRYSINHENSIIIQCKHYLDSGFARLLRDLRNDEKPKIARLSPARYIVVTSLPLNPREKHEIVTALHPYVKMPGDIIGKETINSLLLQYPEVEINHFKLWLSSVSVLKRVLLNAERVQTEFNVDRVRKSIPLYVQNKAYDQAIKILNEQKFVIISGVPGIGKTTLADLLLYTHLEASFEPIVIQSDITEGRRLFNNERKQVFYFDDFLGETFLGNRFDFIGRKEDSSLLDFMEMIRESKHSRLILTTREHILRQAFDISERFNRGKESLSVHQCVLELASYTLKGRGRILYNHIYFSDLPGIYKGELLRDRFYMNILKHRNYNPRLVEWLSKFTNVKSISVGEYRKEVLRVLDHPATLWRIAYEQQISDASRSLLLALYSLGGNSSLQQLEMAWQPLHQGRTEKYHLKATPEDWRKSLQDMEGGFLTFQASHFTSLFSPEVGFINPSVKDFFDDAIATHSANLQDLLIAAVYFNQIIQLWSLFEAKISSIPELQTYSVDFVAAAERLAWQPHRDNAENRFGRRVWRNKDATPEVRLNAILSIAEQTRSDSALKLAERFVQHLLNYWKEHSPDFSVAVGGLRVLDDANWNVLTASRMHESLKVALLNGGEAGAGSNDLAALISYADQRDARWSVEDDTRLQAICVGYLSGTFDEELRDCTSEGELSSLDEAVAQIAAKCGISNESHESRIAQRTGEYEDQDVDDNDIPASYRGRERASNIDDSTQELEIIRLFDGLL